MAKAPKAPGKNGPSDLRALADALDQKIIAVGDGYWQGQVLLGSLVALARALGDERARAVLARVTVPSWKARGTAHVAEGLALAGHTELARKAIEETHRLLQHPEVDGEEGTLAWRAAAYAYGALGDEAGVDRCLAEALQCAKNERSNPTQPWPHLAVAYAVLGRDALLEEHLREHAGGTWLSFDDARAAELIVRRAVERGDVAGFVRWSEFLAEHNGYYLSSGLKEGALVAATAHPDALVEVVAAFAANESYGDDGCATVAWRLGAAGHVELARAVVTAAQRHSTREAPLLALCARQLDAAATDVTLGDGLHAFIEPFRLRWAVAPDAARALADAHELSLRSALAAGGATPSENLAALGIALVQVGEHARGTAIVNEALTQAAALSGGAKASALKSIGVAASERDLADAGLFALRKLTSKYARTDVSKALSLSYVRAHDYLGAVAVVAMGEERPLSQAMRLCDALSAAAGTPRAFTNYA
ncbi:MAG: hypothetical protein Q8S73_29095 [Deltaproteobacteria bacterium]|nr:hypothetical protein [Myxococcales bacterium]MDP3218198.1 hypothetical protein [Deltaproteobacteria bacterium]